MYTEMLHEGTPLARRREMFVLAMVTEPRKLLQMMLKQCELSSLDIERASGVPASVVRSIRNNTTTDVKSETWSRLMWWLLERRPWHLLVRRLPAYETPGERVA